jgi:hypothetical protein
VAADNDVDDPVFDRVKEHPVFNGEPWMAQRTGAGGIVRRPGRSAGASICGASSAAAAINAAFEQEGEFWPRPKCAEASRWSTIMLKLGNMTASSRAGSLSL